MATIVGDGGNNTLTGTSGNDSISGLDGDDSLSGNGGNDTLDGGVGNDTLDAGPGMQTMRGRAGDDTYIVYDSDNTINEFAGEGTDTVKTSLVVYFLNPNVENLIFLGNGTQGFFGVGNSANNYITGGAYDDTINGAGGSDTMAGGTGNDTYYVHSASDQIIENPGEGTDTVWSNLTSYTLGANLENLVLVGTGFSQGTAGFGNAGDNSISSGNGTNDTIDGGAGADTMAGGDGNDLFIVDNSNDLVIESANGGADTIDTALSSFTLAANVENLVFTGVGDFSGTGNSGSNSLSGGDGNDTLDGGGGSDWMAGGKGSDTYYVDQDGKQIIENPNEGTDTIITTWGYIDLGFNVENVIYVGSGDFHGIGYFSNNQLTSGAGNDTLDGGGGDDTLTGGLGNDTYYASAYFNNENDVIIERPDEGIDTVITIASTFTLPDNVENLTHTGGGMFYGVGNDLDNTLQILFGSGSHTLDGGAGADTLIGGGGDNTYLIDSDDVVVGSSFGIDTVITSLGAYTLGADIENVTFVGTGDFTGTGNAGNNDISGAAGDDLLTGDLGNDTLNGGAGTDTLIGGDGNDTYFVDDPGDVVIESDGSSDIDSVITSLAYTLGANVENLTFVGSGDFTGTGNAEDNQISGGSGNDALNGSAGDDTLDGGDGTDTAFYTGVRAAYAISLTGSTFTIIDGRPGSPDGADNVTNVEYFQFSDGTVSAGNLLNVPGVTITGTTNADLMDAAHTVAGQPLPTNEADTISGGKGNDSIDALGGNDLVSGDAGNDSLLGGAGNDSIDGGIGNDTLLGGDGDDTLDGGTGTDQLSGGLGNDVYIVDKAADIVTENPGEGTDTVKTGLGSYVFGSNLENLIYTGAANFKGTGNALDNLITGSAGNDTLTGGGGADTVTGGAGADHFVYGPGDVASGPAFDEITDFSHADGDRISLSAIDANSNTLANESFVFIGAGAFTHAARQLHYVVNGSGGVNVEGDTNGDGVADFSIAVDGVNSLAASDFML